MYNTHMNKNLVLVGGICLVKENRNKLYWFLVDTSSEEENEFWEIPKNTVRKVESSVKSVIRMMGEQGGMSIRILEEAGRSGGVTMVSGKTIPQRIIYYVGIVQSAEGEPIGFPNYAWVEHSKAVKKLGKREQAILKAAKKEYKKWVKQKANQPSE